MLRHPAVRSFLEPRWVCAALKDVRPRGAGAVDDPAVPAGYAPRSSWLHRAACRGAPPALFWGRTATTRKRAVELCERCPVRRDCLLDAFVLPPGGGIRAGTSEKERRLLMRLA